MQLLLSLLIMLGVTFPCLAGSIIPLDCHFEAKDIEYSINKKVKYSNFVEEEILHIRVKNKLSHCGELDFKLLSFPKGKLAPLLTSLTNTVTPSEWLALKKDPTLAIAMLESKFKSNEYVYSYEEKQDWLNDNVFSLTQTIYVFTGGAHGNTGVRKIAFNLKNKKQFTLSTLFKKENIAGLMALAKAEFIKARKLEVDKPLKDQGFWFKPTDIQEHVPWVTLDGFYLPENFNLNKNGVTFVYQQYEIAPYSYGILKFTLPWETLKNYLLGEIVEK